MRQQLGTVNAVRRGAGRAIATALIFVAASAAGLVDAARAVPADSLAQVLPNPVTYVEQTDFLEMSASPPGSVGARDVTAPVWAVDLLIPSTGGSTSGCEATDFLNFPLGYIALIQRGTCDFGDKALNAANAGASGVLIFNDGDPNGAGDRFGVLAGTVQTTVVPVPVMGTSFAVGDALRYGVVNGAAAAAVRMVTDGAVRTMNIGIPQVASISESGGSTTLLVSRIGLGSGAVGATISVGGTAGAGERTVSPTTVSFADGDTAPKTITITAIDDAVVDGDKTVIVSLTNGTGVITLSQATSTVTIVDDDAGSGALACPFGSTVVSGNRPSFTAPPGSTCLRQVQVNGTLVIPAGANVTLLSSKVVGNVTATQPQGFRACGTVFGGSVVVSGATGPVVIGDPAACAGNQIAGSVSATNNSGGVTIKGNRIGGHTYAAGNVPAAVISGNTR